ncbi:MAG: hypothetical protein V3U87_10225 [Methylococcaceae bacterium]
MTDRLNGVTITFDRDIREDDAERILDAFRMVKGVVHVEPNIVTHKDHFTEMKVKTDVRDKLYKFISTELK